MFLDQPRLVRLGRRVLPNKRALRSEWWAADPAKEPFLPNAKLAAREGEDNRAKAAIEWTVNLGIRRF
jgi:hypothetical protein